MAKRSKSIEHYVHRHLVFGWWCLCGFIVLGLILDYFHAFKVGWYLDVGNESRRLMGTLAHAHGTLLGGLNVAFALTIERRQERALPFCRFASPCLMSATLMIPAGFLLGGVFTLSGEPGVAVFMVPVGALLLLSAVVLTAWGIRKPSAEVTRESGKKAK